MFALYVSYDCGVSYSKIAEAKTLDELRPKMREFDEDRLRWYLTKDGEDYWEELSTIHSNILLVMTEANKSVQPTS